MLGPGQERVVGRALPLATELGEGWRVDASRVEEGRVVVSLASSGGEQAQVSIVGERDGAGRETSQGWLVAPPAVPAVVVDELARRLDRAPARLVWRDPGASDDVVRAPAVDAARAHAAREALRRRLEVRWGLAAGRPEPSRVAPLDLGGSGARPEPEPTDLGVLAERHPDDPRALAWLGRQARLAGELEAASRWIGAALALPVADELVLREAAALGWHVAASVDGAQAAPSESGDGGGRPAWPWWLAGSLFVGLLLLAAARRRDLVLVGGLVAALGAGAAVAATALQPPMTPGPPLVPQPMLLPLAGGPCDTLPTRVDPAGGWSVPVRCGGGWAHLTVVATPAGVDTQAAAVTTAHHTVGLRTSEPASGELLGSAALLAEAVRAVEAVGGRAPGPARGVTREAGWPTWAAADAATRAELAVGAVVTLAALLLALVILATRLPLLAARGPMNRWVIAAFVGAALAHTLAPSAMIMVFGGYDLTGLLVAGEVPRYGVGSVWLYGLPMWWLGHDHAWIQGINRVAGLLACFAAWDLGREVWVGDGGRGRIAAVVCAWLLALLPVIWRADTSESILVVPALLWLVGLRLWSTRPAAAALLLGAAALCRPELAVVTALVPAWSWASTREWPDVGASAAVWSLVAVTLWSALAVATSLNSESALPGLDRPIMGIRSAIEGIGILSNPDMTPLGMWLCLAAGVTLAPRPRAGWPTLALAVLWLGATGVDLVAVSVPRLHTPILLWVLPLIARGAVELGARGWSRGVAWRGVCVAAVAVSVLSGAWTGHHLFEATNEDAEDALWRDAIARLPADRPGCLATVGYSDPPPARKSPRFTPGYLLDARHEGWQVFDLSQVEQALEACGPDTWVLHGVRCYVDLRQEPPRPPPPAGTRIEACVDAEARWALEPWLERDVANRGDLAFPMYPAGGTLRLGLYRVVGPR